MSICLTASQKESYDFIQKYYKKNNVLPTLSEIAADAGCTVPGIAYRVAAAFLKGAYGHNANNTRHVITEPMQEIAAPTLKFEDVFASCYSREEVKRHVFDSIHYLYSATELFEGRKNGPRGGPLTYMMRDAKKRDLAARKEAARLAVGFIDELVAEGKIEGYGIEGTLGQPENRNYKQIWWSHDFKTESDYDAYRLADARAEEEQNKKNELATALLELLKSSPKFNEIAAVLRG